MSKKNTDEIIVTPEQKVEEITNDYKKFEKRQVTLVVINDDKEFANANTFLIDVKSRINRVKELRDEYINR